MIKQIAAACLLGTALASAPAFAQSANPSNNAGNFLTQMSGDEWRGSKLVGVDVYGSDNQKIGDINEVIVDRNGQAKAIVIGVGGFLGIGEKNVAVSWDKVQWNTAVNPSSGSMASNNAGAGSSGSSTMAVSSGGQPAGDRSTPRDVAQTTTGSPNESNAQPAQTAASGGAALSSAPSTGTTANAPAATSPSVASTSTSSSSASSPAASNASSAGRDVTSSGSASNQDYPDRALVSMSKQDLQNAPDFHYKSQNSSASGGSKGGAGGPSLTGSTSGR